jgi:hypothetical protein
MEWFSWEEIYGKLLFYPRNSTFLLHHNHNFCIRIGSGTTIRKNDTTLKDRCIQLHFSFVSKQLEVILTEEVLRNIFIRYGAVTDVVMKKYSQIAVSQI